MAFENLNKLQLTPVKINSLPTMSICPGSACSNSPFLYHVYVGFGLPTALQRHLTVWPGSVRRWPMENGKYGRAVSRTCFDVNR